LTLTNPYPATFDNFGWSVAIAGTLVIVGVPFDNVGATDAGAALCYDLAGATRPFPCSHSPTPVRRSDFFGSSVAVSGSRVVVGSYDDDTLAGNSGSAYVYDLAGGTPSVPILTLTNPSTGVEDRFGCSVAISGTTVLVGADGDDNGTMDTGSTHLYRLDAVHPTEPVATFSEPSQKSSDFFGISTAVSGTRIVVGAYQDDTGANDAGSAYVYDLASTTPRVPVLRIANPARRQGINSAIPVPSLVPWSSLERIRQMLGLVAHTCSTSPAALPQFPCSLGPIPAPPPTITLVIPLPSRAGALQSVRTWTTPERPTRAAFISML